MPRIQKIGNSHGIVVSATALAQANLVPGDRMVMAPLQDGIVIAAEGSATGRMLSAMLEGMDQYSETFRTLASERLSDDA